MTATVPLEWVMYKAAKYMKMCRLRALSDQDSDSGAMKRLCLYGGFVSGGNQYA